MVIIIIIRKHAKQLKLVAGRHQSFVKLIYHASIVKT